MTAIDQKQVDALCERLAGGPENWGRATPTEAFTAREAVLAFLIAARAEGWTPPSPPEGNRSAGRIDPMPSPYGPDR